MDERDEIDGVEWLKSVADPAERARFAREFGWIDSTDFEMNRYLTGQCLSRASDDQALLATVRGAPDLTKEGRRCWQRLQNAIKNVQRRDEIARARGLRVPRSVWARTEALPARLVPALVDQRRQTAGDMKSDTVSDFEKSTHSGESAPARPNGPDYKAPSVLIDKPHRDVRPPRGSLTERIAVEAYERQRRIWPHIKTPAIPKPAWYDAYRADKKRADEGAAARVRDPSNPFDCWAPAPRRSADLTRNEFERIYRAMAFALDRGIVMSMHIIILWETYGVRDHERAAKLTGKVIEAATKWSLVGMPSEDRQRHRQRTGDGHELAWVFAHESGHGRGFHSHILCNVRPRSAAAFEPWLRATLQRLTRQSGDRRSLRVVVSRASTTDSQVRDHWRWFRYISKGLPASVALQYRGQPVIGPMRDAMNLWRYRDGAPGVTCMRMAGASHNLGDKARTRAGFKAKLDQGPAMFERFYDGSELEDGRWRREIAEALATLNT